MVSLCALCWLQAPSVMKTLKQNFFKKMLFTLICKIKIFPELKQKTNKRTCWKKSLKWKWSKNAGKKRIKVSPKTVSRLLEKIKIYLHPNHTQFRKLDNVFRSEESMRVSRKRRKQQFNQVPPSDHAAVSQHKEWPWNFTGFKGNQ